MTWNYTRAKERIQKELGEAPQIETKRYSDQYLPAYEYATRRLVESGGKTTPPLVNLEKGTAVLVDTVQIYIKLKNFDEYLLSEGVETESSHKRALEFLHLYYSACDRVIERSEAQRVDFHGGRLHMVVLDSTGEGISESAVARAFRLVSRFQSVAEKANEELGNSEFPVTLRIGIDTGMCVAINNGTGDEQEPMFLGSAANYAAKLAEGVEEGIFVSDRVRNIVNTPEIAGLEGVIALNENTMFEILERNRATVEGALVTENRESFANDILEQWRSDIKLKEIASATDVDFKFFYKSPPLSEIDFAELMPSHTARLPMATLFADISGYTAYIDSCIEKGDIANAVRALYVIRAEFQNVVEQDFDGRKIRFIGDCIQAIVAEGDQQNTSSAETVFEAVSCSGGLRSSFDICLDEIGGLQTLGLSIGIEFGTTPVTRLGIRGERSVRVASSSTTAAAELLQSNCELNETRIGPKAYKYAPVGTSDLFDSNGVSYEEITYADVAGGLASPAIVPPQPTPQSNETAHSFSTSEQPRAHLRYV